MLLLACLYMCLGCNQIAKKASKDIVDTGTRKTVNSISSEFGEKSLRNLSPDGVMNYNWRAVLIELGKDNPQFTDGICR